MADVSVIIPCHNAGRHVGATLQSVLGQTHAPGEVLVVDDGSTDDTASVVQHHAEASQGVVRLIQQPNGGVSKARNVAIDQAQGQYIAFVDADDLWLPDKLARQLALFEQHPESAGTHCRAFNFQSELDDRNREETERSKDNPSVEQLIRHHWVITSSAVVRRDSLGELRFDETTGHAEDMILFADIRMNGPWRMVDELLLAKRIHPNQATASPWHRIWAVETRVQWCRMRREKIGDELAQRLEHDLCKQLINFLENRYWRRQFDELHDMRQRVAQLCPELMSQSFLSRSRIYPRWVYRLRDAFTRQP